MVADIKMDSRTVPFFFRDQMAVLVDAAQSAPSVSLHGERRVDANGNVVRSGTLDSDIYLSAQEDVASDARYSGIENKFVMAVQLFSDAALVSWSRGMSCLLAPVPSLCLHCASRVSMCSSPPASTYIYRL